MLFCIFIVIIENGYDLSPKKILSNKNTLINLVEFKNLYMEMFH